MIVFNPVRIVFGADGSGTLRELTGGRRVAVITTPGALSRGVVSTLLPGADGSLPVFTEVRPNPTVESITRAAEQLLGDRPQVIVAIGGGSVMDTAKGVAAIGSPGIASSTWLSDHLRGGAPFPAGFFPLPVIAIPTTSGTGSEVTMWGTVWDEASGAKHSISHPALHPEAAVLMPALTLSMSRELTIVTGLDALSHCFESLWNRKSNAVSESFASTGAKAILSALPSAVTNPDDLEVRRRMQDAALLAGLAISSTATALAHSISYPLTSILAMPHGLACSFTLPAIMRFNAEAFPERMQLVAEAIGARDVSEAADTLDRLFELLGVRELARSYLPADKVSALRARLLTPGRAENNIRPATLDDALAIVQGSLG